MWFVLLQSHARLQKSPPPSTQILSLLPPPCPCVCAAGISADSSFPPAAAQCILFSYGSGAILILLPAARAWAPLPAWCRRPERWESQEQNVKQLLMWQEITTGASGRLNVSVLENKTWNAAGGGGKTTCHTLTEPSDVWSVMLELTDTGRGWKIWVESPEIQFCVDTSLVPRNASVITQ